METKLILDDQDLIRELSSLAIETKTECHEPLMTVQDAQILKSILPGAHPKNLFLRDKFNKYWMITTLDDTKVDLKATAQKLGAMKFTFAKPAELEELLGIKPGAVSPFALINDMSSLVTFAIEKRMLEHAVLNFHPLRNDRTITLAADDFLKFLQSIKHEPIILEF